MNREDLLFYDIEVFAFDSLVVFMDITGREEAHFWNNRDRQCVEDPSGFDGIRGVITGRVLVGYNNYSYDDHILTAMLNPARNMSHILKAINNTIIGQVRLQSGSSYQISGHYAAD